MPRGGTQPLSAQAAKLGMPAGFTDRAVPDQLSSEYEAALVWLRDQRPRRQNFWPALVLSFISVVEQVTAQTGLTSIPEGLNSDVISPETAAPGTVVNTLNVVHDGEVIARLRSAYNAVLRVIRVEMRRSHPSNPGHATQAWPSYRTLIDLIFELSPAERLALAEYVWDTAVLPLEETVRSVARVRQPRPFYDLIERFDTSSSRGGALFQAMVYGYLCADSPNLSVESHSVNTGSSRAGAIGDVSGYAGEFLVIAAEAKDKDLSLADEDDLTSFMEDAASSPDLDAVVFARSFDEEILAVLEAASVRAMSKPEMLRTVKIWDIQKQEAAVRYMRYYLTRIQKKPDLLTGLDGFLGEIVQEHLAEVAAEEAARFH